MEKRFSKGLNVWLKAFRETFLFALGSSFLNFRPWKNEGIIPTNGPFKIWEPFQMVKLKGCKERG